MGLIELLQLKVDRRKTRKMIKEWLKTLLSNCKNNENRCTTWEKCKIMVFSRKFTPVIKGFNFEVWSSLTDKNKSAKAGRIRYGVTIHHRLAGGKFTRNTFVLLQAYIFVVFVLEIHMEVRSFPSKTYHLKQRGLRGLRN